MSATGLVLERPAGNPLDLRPQERECCPACGGAALRPVLSMQAVPTNSCLMLDSPEEARAYPRGDIALSFCEGCGFVFNRAFEPKLTEYSERYEPTQGYSGTFLRFHRDLAERVVAQTGLRGGTVVEVGCGQGEFLHMLCRLGAARGIGFDPCLSEARADVVAERADSVNLIGDFFSEASIAGLKADLLVSKMTLEHIPAARGFAAAAARLAAASAPGMRLFIMVPECERIFAAGGFEDIYYEHCSYFTAAPLAALFARHGFEVEAVTREYAGQYLALHARFTGAAATGVGREEIARLGQLVARFGEVCAGQIASWRRLVAQRQAAGQGVVLWGSGSKGVAFLNALGGGEGISHVVDINPHRQGRFMVGTGHPIVGPAALTALRPATVILMNPVYQQEVAAQLAALGLAPELLSL